MSGNRNRLPVHADHLYDYSDWEYTIPVTDLSIAVDHVVDSDEGIVEFGTLIDGPKVYGAVVPVSFDEYGDPDETEVRWFTTREEAEAARNREPEAQP